MDNVNNCKLLLSNVWYFRYKHIGLSGASSWIFADTNQQFSFDEIQIKGHAHLAIMPKNSYTDMASVNANKVTGDKTGESELM